MTLQILLKYNTWQKQHFTLGAAMARVVLLVVRTRVQSPQAPHTSRMPGSNTFSSGNIATTLQDYEMPVGPEELWEGQEQML